MSLYCKRADRVNCDKGSTVQKGLQCKRVYSVKESTIKKGLQCKRVYRAKESILRGFNVPKYTYTWWGEGIMNSLMNL
jgi:hypothetical protein